jgi:2-polyprenyl-6-hydroxyphenyl methylase/3-demethylubiquinone-9 3-methyltransferase
MDDFKENNMNTEMHASEVAQGERFEFGKNWSTFIEGLTEEKIREAELSLKNMLRIDTLEGQTFLDIGSGSGLFSLTARRLGATVTSFDYDPFSVGCTKSLKERIFSLKLKGNTCS